MEDVFALSSGNPYIGLEQDFTLFLESERPNYNKEKKLTLFFFNNKFAE